MGICDRRHFLLTICILQIITTVERQVFDFLGYMWIPILVNFFNIIFVILGFFGAYQYRTKYLISYCSWNVLWLTWNIFLICFYSEVEVLENNVVLNFDPNSCSWWFANGPGCKVKPGTSDPQILPTTRPEVEGCLIDYKHIEIGQAGIQCLLGLIGIFSGFCVKNIYIEEDDSFDFVGGDEFGLARHTPLHPIYVSYSSLPKPASFQKNSSSFVPCNQTNHSRQPIRQDKKTTNKDKEENEGRKIIIDSSEYSNPIDHLKRAAPGLSYDEYDSLYGESKFNTKDNHQSRYSSPVLSVKGKKTRPTKQSRISFDYAREQSYSYDPRLG